VSVKNVIFEKNINMARADLLLSLVKYGASGNKQMFKKVVEAIIAEEREKNHQILANKLDSAIRLIQSEQNGNSSSFVDGRIENLLQEISPDRSIEDLILPEDVINLCYEIVQEQHRVDLLRSYGLEPRNRLLLIGPPGTGKTSLAEAIAEMLIVPLYIVRYEGIVGTYLGETANRLRKVIDFVSTRKCVLFFDEFETLGKERGDLHETGEIKRVVSSLLLQIDNLPSHVMVIGATNHPELLDRAVWRRFNARVNLPLPSRSRIEEYFEKFQIKHNINFEYATSTLAKKMFGCDFSELEEFGISVLRQYVLNIPNSDIRKIVAKELKGWDDRNIKIQDEWTYYYNNERPHETLGNMPPSTYREKKEKEMIDVQICKCNSAYELCKAETSAFQAALHTSTANASGGLSEINQLL
jgi:SpoVK/Ycf46/Vps4 family AAA+-type ATPase